MGILFNVNTISFLEYVPLKTSYDSLKEFRKDADDLYQILAVRCYVSAIIYGFFAVISLVCIRIKNKQIEGAANKKRYTKELV